MLAAHQEGRVQVTIGRASDYYGARRRELRLRQPVFGRVLEGSGRSEPGSSTCSTPSTICPTSPVGSSPPGPEADGEVWHLPAAEPLTAQEFFDLAFEAAGRPTPAKAQIAGPTFLAVAGIFSPMLRELRETAYQFRRPFVIDSSKFERAFGQLEPTPHREAVKQTVEWFRSG
jgi:hypothetical protein